MPGLGRHYQIEEDIVRIPRKKTASIRRNSSASGAEDALNKLRSHARVDSGGTQDGDADAPSVGIHNNNNNNDAGAAGDMNDDEEVEDGEEEEDNDDSYVNITVKREDPIAAAMKVVEISGSVEERRTDSFDEGE